MSQSEKAQYFRELKAAGVQFDKHYREYSTAELKAAHTKLVEADPARAVEAGLINPPPAVVPPHLFEDPLAHRQVKDEPQFDPAGLAAAYADMTQAEQPREPIAVESRPRQSGKNNEFVNDAAQRQPRTPAAPVAAQNPDEMPGQRLNQSAELEPIRTDENGLVWYQEEVRKPAFPKPRGRRVLKYMESGVEVQTVQNGEYVETFEVADGKAARRESEVKITLPSYQVGIYKDRRFPWKIHVYNEVRGFDLFEVQDYYGGAELVPQEIKRMYVENVLCYDIRTTVRAVQTEYRQQQLQNRG